MSDRIHQGPGLLDMLGGEIEERIQVPYLTLVQSRDEHHPEDAGKYRVSMLDAALSAPKFQILALRRGRRFYAGNQKTGKPDCWSKTGLAPALAVRKPNAQECRSCRYSKWTGENPPDCQEEIVLAGRLVDQNLPVLFALRSTALSCWRSMYSAMALTSGGNPEPSRFIWTLSSRERVAQKQRYYVPIATVFSSVEPPALEAAVLPLLDYLGSDTAATDGEEG